MSTHTNAPGIDMLAAVLGLIADSQLVLREQERDCVPISRSLPAGFDHVDLAILEWIAAEGRRIGRRLAQV